MKVQLTVRKVVTYTKSVEVEIPDEDFIGCTPCEAETKLMDYAVFYAPLEDFSEFSEAKNLGAKYFSSEPQLPWNINWIKTEVPDSYDMVIGSMSPVGTLGTVEQ
jgi:hypothetical protein